MKKTIALAGLILALSITLTGCQKPVKQASLLLSDSSVKSSVKGWSVYTNPQFRYEIRVPQDWQKLQPTEGGEEVTFYPGEKFLTDQYPGALKIDGIVNWREQYTLEQYFDLQQMNLFEKVDEDNQEEISFRDNRAMWFKSVEGLYTDQTVDVVAIDLKDRLLIVQFLSDRETADVIFNSMSFYGTRALSDLTIPDKEDDSNTMGRPAAADPSPAAEPLKIEVDTE